MVLSVFTNLEGLQITWSPPCPDKQVNFLHESYLTLLSFRRAVLSLLLLELPISYQSHRELLLLMSAGDLTPL